MRFVSIFNPFRAFHTLGEDGESSTLERLITSRHVADLRFIFSCAMWLMLFGIGVAIVQRMFFTSGEAPKYSDVNLVTYVGAIIVFIAGILSWTYQAGSARLGIVDLFACEIGTLCRVFVVVDLTRRYVDAFGSDLGKTGHYTKEQIDGIRESFKHYDSTESYMPLFDNHAGDLRVLDIKVVTHVTEFYTYVKAMRDSLRRMTNVQMPGTATPISSTDAWHASLISVLYMQFLALESARKAMTELIEFEPHKVEDTITILISELCAFTFLLEQLNTGNDFRHARLKLREHDYHEIVGRAYWRAKKMGEDYEPRMRMLESEYAELMASGTPPSAWERRENNRQRTELQRWHRAAEVANELAQRYLLLFPEKKEVYCPPDLAKPRGSLASERP